MANVNTPETAQTMTAPSNGEIHDIAYSRVCRNLGLPEDTDNALPDQCASAVYRLLSIREDNVHSNIANAFSPLIQYLSAEDCNRLGQALLNRMMTLAKE